MVRVAARQDRAFARRGTLTVTRMCTGARAGALGAVLLAVVGWSASALFVRAAHTDAVVYTTWRLWFALPPLAALVAIRRRRNPRIVVAPRAVSRGRWMLVLIGGGAFFASSAATAFIAIDSTRLLDVTLITSLQPVLVMAFAATFLAEHVSVRQYLMATVAIAGTIVVATSASGSGTWSVTGDLVAVASLVLNAGWFLYCRAVRARFDVDPIAFMFGVLATAAVLLTPVAAVATGSLGLPAAALGFAACTMVTGTTAHVLMVWAHRYVRASVSAPLLLAEPPLVAIAAWLLFGEALGLVEIVGSLVVVAVLVGMVREQPLERVEDEAPDPLAPA
jgi:drug/metabolite transporter (DMT)-like permease